MFGALPSILSSFVLALYLLCSWSGSALRPLKGTFETSPPTIPSGYPYTPYPLVSLRVPEYLLRVSIKILTFMMESEFLVSAVPHGKKTSEIKYLLPYELWSNPLMSGSYRGYRGAVSKGYEALDEEF